MSRSKYQGRQSGESFQTTQWSEVLLASQDQQSGCHDAMCRLCEKYWYPIYAFLRRSGHNRADAEDLTQAFFTSVVDDNKLAVADSSRGRFRSFLLVACRNFVSNEQRRGRGLRHGGGTAHVAINVDTAVGSQRYESQSTDGWTPEQIFDRQWALELLDLAIKRVRKDYAGRGQGEWFDALQPYIAPIGTPPPHAEVAETMNTSVGAVKTAIHRLRKRFGQVLQQEVAETLVDSGDTKDELNILLDALGGR